ncbi:MAG: hypothetical protein J0I88_10740, partial [Chryseobacterium sp.]|nr:hypothetical protein [Chryseobacterium sp.]
MAKEKELSSAKVVIPDYLFIDAVAVPPVAQTKDFTVGSSEVGSNDTISGGNNINGIQNTESENNISENSQVFLPTESMLKRQKVALANVEKEQLEKLKKELSKAQKLYHKEYSKAYDLATKQYQKSIIPEREAYEQRLLEVEATFTPEMTEAAKKLALSQVAKPQFPDFEFEFRAERDTAYLQTKLSEVSLFTLAKLIAESTTDEDLSGRLSNGNVAAENVLEIGKEQYILPADENLNFEEMLETLNTRLSELNEEIYQNTEIEKQEYASVGGVLIPVNKGNNDITFSYELTSEAFKGRLQSGKYWRLYPTLIFPDSTWDISSMSYQVKTNLGINKVDSYFTYLKEGTKIKISELFSNEFILSESDFPNSIIFNIDFRSGKRAKIEINKEIVAYTLYTGLFEIETDATTNSNTSSNAGNSFIPKGFGIKRLGIADYLKVEQTTHAYVEGEVANIENIMAREYRNQSTRRLRKSETIDTQSSDTERERSTDTTTSSRFEMQSEIAKILQEATDMGINANVGYSNQVTGFSMNVAGSYANHRSKEESMRQAVSQAQEVTARALDRVVTKVHQERVEKMIEEFEENNTHGFDNRKGDQHVVGVYRWVDKLMKNQVWNYGKRLMFEFAIPQPSKLHRLAAASVKKVIQKPVDPRTANDFNLSDFSKMDESNLKCWTGVYNVKLDERPQNEVFIGKSFSDKIPGSKGNPNEVAAESVNVEIPIGYETVSAAVNTKNSGDWYDPSSSFYSYPQILVGNTLVGEKYENIDAFVGAIPVSFSQA